MVVPTRSRRIVSTLGRLDAVGISELRYHLFWGNFSFGLLKGRRLRLTGPFHVQFFHFSRKASTIVGSLDRQYSTEPRLSVGKTFTLSKQSCGELVALRSQRKATWTYSQSVYFLRKLQGGSDGLQKVPTKVGSPRKVGNFGSLCLAGRLEKAMDVLCSMEQQGIIPSTSTYWSLLKACTPRKALAEARQIQLHLSKSGFESSQFLGETVVETFVKCGGLQDALQVFHRLPRRTVFSWTAVISGYTMAGQAQEALRMYHAMREEGLEANKYTFVSLLKACSSISDLEQGRRLHVEIKNRSLDSNLFVGTCLVDMYVKCGSVDEGQNVFDGLLDRDIVSWNAMIAGYTQHDQPQKALELYRQLLQGSIAPDDRTFVSILQACGMLAERGGHGEHGQRSAEIYLDLGREVHAYAVRKDYESDIFVSNTLVSMYGKCGSIMDAQIVFDRMPKRTVVSWNAMISAFCQQNQPDKALHYYERMVEEGLSPNIRTFVSLFQACGILAEKEDATFISGEAVKPESLKIGKSMHVDASRRGHLSDYFLENTLIGMYGKCGSITDARIVFDMLSQQNVVSWNAILGAHVLQGRARETLELYEQMIQDGVSYDERTFVIVTQACGILAEEEDNDAVDTTRLGRMKYLQMGRVMHADACSKGYCFDVYVGNGLVSMYGKCGCIEDAHHVFASLSRRDVVSWNTMIVAYTQQGNAREALQLYEHMLEEGMSSNNRTLVSTLQACGMCAEAEEGTRDLKAPTAKLLLQGKALHADAWAKGHVSDVFIGNTLVSMYAKCKSISDAQLVFDELLEHNLVAWSVLLAAYAEQGQAEKALQLYEQMLAECVSPDASIVVSTLQACGMLAEQEEDVLVDGQLTKLTSLAIVKALHGAAWRKGLESDVVVANTLVSMYGKCGSIRDAQNVFDGLYQQDVVSWTALLSAYAQQGRRDKVLKLYTEMQAAEVCPNDITLVCILQACGSAGRLDVCSQIYRSCVSAGGTLSLLLGNTLIHAYGRCNSMVDAREVFWALLQPDVVSWNALMAGYARLGDHATTLQCFEEMLEAGTKPDQVTFLSLISASSHVGSVDRGLEYFKSMSTDYGLTPAIEHYVTVVDLLGRAGYFTAVEHLLSTMPGQPNLCLWICLLGACRKHSKVLLGKRAFDQAVCLQPRHPVPYILMSSIYANAGLWESAMQVHELRQNAAAWKTPGQSWLWDGSGQQVFTFRVGDLEDQQQVELTEMLISVSLQLALEVYAAGM